MTEQTNHILDFFVKMYEEFSQACPAPPEDRSIMLRNGHPLISVAAFKDWFMKKREDPGFYPAVIAEDYKIPLESAEECYGLFNQPNWLAAISQMWPYIVTAHRGFPENPVRFCQIVMLLGFDDGVVVPVNSSINRDLMVNEKSADGANPQIPEMELVRFIMHQGGGLVNHLFAYPVDQMYKDHEDQGNFFRPEVSDSLLDLVTQVVTQLRGAATTDASRKAADDILRLATLYHRLFTNRIASSMLQELRANQVIEKHKGEEEGPRPRGGFTN